MDCKSRTQLSDFQKKKKIPFDSWPILTRNTECGRWLYHAGGVNVKVGDGAVGREESSTTC